MLFYEFMNRMPVPRSFLGKILSVSFLGVHVPMIGAVLYILASVDVSFGESMGMLAALLAATLLGTLATLAALTFLLAPIRVASNALENYLERRDVPSLPTGYSDSAGRLMANVQKSITHLDVLIDNATTQRQELLSSHRSKFELLASLSHEIRTPLNHVIGFAELMSSEALGPMKGKTYKTYAQDIGSSGQDLLELLQSVLDLSAAEAGLVDAELRSVDLVPFLRRTVGLIHERAQAGEIDVDLFVTGADEVSIMSDERTLKQVLLHSFQVAMADVSTTTKIDVSVDHAMHQASVIIQSDSPWLTDDIPPEFLPVNAVRTMTSPPAATPTAVRIAMISSLANAIGGAIWVGGTRGDQSGRALTVTLPMVDMSSDLPAVAA